MNTKDMLEAFSKHMEEQAFKNQTTNTSAGLLGSGISGVTTTGSITLRGTTGGIRIDNPPYGYCQKCGQTYSGYTIHCCSAYKQEDYLNQLMMKQSGIALSLLSSPSKVQIMNKDTLVVFTENGGIVESTDKGLDEAKRIARDYTNRNKLRCYIFKPVWNCAPKTDLVESEL